jgi:hypothetical protein
VAPDTTPPAHARRCAFALSYTGQTHVAASQSLRNIDGRSNQWCHPNYADAKTSYPWSSSSPRGADGCFIAGRQRRRNRQTVTIRAYEGKLLGNSVLAPSRTSSTKDNAAGQRQACKQFLGRKRTGMMSFRCPECSHAKVCFRQRKKP